MDRDTIGQVPGCRSSGIRRRTILAGMAGLLGGCVAPNPDLEPPREPPEIAYYRAIYAARVDGRVSIPAVDPRRIDPRYLRQVVQHSGPESPGTVVVDPDKRFLHLVLESGEALRYGVGVGREGFGWNGSARIGRKAEWPTWTPPKEMIERQPETAEWASGMPGGLDNPLGARAPPFQGPPTSGRSGWP